MKKNNHKKNIDFINMIKEIYPMSFKTSPVYSVLLQIINILTELANGVILLATQWFFDAALQASSGGETLKSVLLVLGVFVSLKLAATIFEGVRQYLVEVHNSRVMGYMMSEIHKKSAKIDPIMYEDPAYLDDINKAANGVGSAIYFNYVTSCIITFHLPYFIFLSV